VGGDDAFFFQFFGPVVQSQIEVDLSSCGVVQTGVCNGDDEVIERFAPAQIDRCARKGYGIIQVGILLTQFGNRVEPSGPRIGLGT